MNGATPCICMQLSTATLILDTSLTHTKFDCGIKSKRNNFMLTTVLHAQTPTTECESYVSSQRPGTVVSIKLQSFCIGLL